MTDEPSRIEERQEEPETLSGYLKSDLPASRYLRKLETSLGAPSEAERNAAAELCLSEPALLTRAVELARLASSEKTESRIRGPIRTWSTEIIRNSAPELQDWGRLASASPEGELSLLAGRLRDIRAKAKRKAATGDEAGTEKDAIAAVEQILRLGLTVTATRLEFDVVASLSSIFDVLNKGKRDTQTLRKKVRDVALRASPKLLQNLAELTRLVRLESDPVREELASVKDRLQMTRDRASKLQETCESQTAEIEKLKKANEDLQGRLGQAETRIEGVMGGADQDMIVLRARVRTLLNRKLVPNLEEAQAGLEHDPPNIDVARHRINAASREIRGELEWLKQFSD